MNHASVSRFLDRVVEMVAISRQDGGGDKGERVTSTGRPALQEEAMRNIRNALFVVIALTGVAAFATDSGIEVLRVSGIEVLRVDTRSWECPPGSLVHAVMDLGAGPMVVDSAPVDPATGMATVHFPMPHPSTAVELRDPTGVLLATDYVHIEQFD